jgi:hypothetical protein
MPQLPPDWEAAVQRWGYLADAEARKYGVANGATLLAKIGYVESRWTRNANLTSSAGAKGWMQFIASTRQAYIDRYGVDPWASLDDAVHAAGLFMKHTGLAGYNPGSSTYISEVLNAPAKVSGKGGGARRAVAGSSRRRSGGADRGPILLRVLLTAALVLAAGALVGVGVSRLVGSSAAQQVASERGQS